MIIIFYLFVPQNPVRIQYLDCWFAKEWFVPPMKCARLLIRSNQQTNEKKTPKETKCYTGHLPIRRKERQQSNNNVEKSTTISDCYQVNQSKEYVRNRNNAREATNRTCTRGSMKHIIMVWAQSDTYIYIKKNRGHTSFGKHDFWLLPCIRLVWHGIAKGVVWDFLSEFSCANSMSDH